MDGKQGTLAHVNIRSREKVGKYGVRFEDIDQLAVPSMIPTTSEMIVVIDEIGKMECFSGLFRKTVLGVLDLENTVIGSIALKGNKFISSIKNRLDTHVVTVSKENRNTLPDQYIAVISKRQNLKVTLPK